MTKVKRRVRKQPKKKINLKKIQERTKKWFKEPIIIRMILLVTIQAFLALLFDIFGLGAGSIGTFTFLGYATNFPQASTFIILLYPPLLSSDGGIGILSSRLGTSLHLGSIKPRFFKNTPQYYTLLSASLTLGLFNGLWIGFISYITNLIALGSTRIANPVPFIVIPVLTLTFASAISSQITSVFSFFLFRRKMNPDVWVYPTMSTINNIFSTVFYGIVIYLFNPKNWFSSETGHFIGLSGWTYFAFLPVGIYILFIAVLFGRNIDKKQYQSILKQAFPIQSLTLALNSVTGGILSAADAVLRGLPGLFLVYPALIDTLGDEATIIANTTSTNLSLGTLDPKIDAIKDKDLWTNLVGVGIAGFLLHILYGIFGPLFANDFRSIGLVLAFSLTINVLGYLLVQTIVFFLMILSFRKGLDPDNFAVPVIAAISNLVCSSLILLLALMFGL